MHMALNLDFLLVPPEYYREVAVCLMRTVLPPRTEVFLASTHCSQFLFLGTHTILAGYPKDEHPVLVIYHQNDTGGSELRNIMFGWIPRVDVHGYGYGYG